MAILSAMETVNAKVPSTIEAAALCKMADRGQITGALLDGPLALDNAISPEAAAIKQIASPVAGRANVLVVPDLEAGNMLAKSLSFLAHADAAGHRARRARADHPDQPRRFTAHAPGVVRRRGHGRRGATQIRGRGHSLKDWTDERCTHQTRSGGPEGAGHRRGERSVDRLRLREGVPHRRRGAGDHLAERAGATLCRAAGAANLQAPITGALDVSVPGQLEAMFDRIRTEWGRLDILVHSIAFAPQEDLQGGLLNCSAEGFAKAMDVSCHSFIRMAKLAAPLMTNGGTMFAMSYYGANRVVANYNVMGPVKAALEAACRYLAYELGPQGIRVHAISPGPLKTRAASGLKDFELLLNEAAQKAPLGELVDIMDVGFACAYLATSLARRITGGTVYVDGGANIVA